MNITAGVFLLTISAIVTSAAQTHFQYTSNTGNNATVVVPATANPNINGTPLASGDEIGVFTPDGLCVGAAVWQGSNTAITVWGDNDQTTEIDGIRAGEVILYRAWKQSIDVEYDAVTVTYLQGNGQYTADGLYTLSSLSATAPPEPPGLVSPADGATDVSTSPVFQWNSSDYADSYRLQASTDSEFSTLVLDEADLPSTSHTVTDLADGTTHYWRVSASNEGGTSAFSAPRSFTTAELPLPDTPALVSPADNAIDQPRTLTLTWENAANASTYDLQVSKNTNFTNLVTDESGLAGTSREISSLEFGTEYVWRVRARNSRGTSAWSAISTFTTIPDAPPTPTPSSPDKDAQNQPLILELSWTAVTEAAWYALQVSTSPSFTTTVVNSSDITGTSLEIGPLTSSTQYYWRVRAGNSGGTSEWSEIWYFRTVPQPPATPTLASPDNNASDQPTTLILSWDPAARSESYHLQVSSDGAFSALHTNDSTLTGTSKQVGSLQTSTTYSWRVRAKNAGGTSGWSSVRIFTTSSGLPPPPAAPTLSSPANGATNVQPPLALSWNSSSGASTYRLQVSVNSNFSGTMLDESGLQSTSRTLNSLEPETKYYWRVRGENQGGASDWSAAWSFTTSVAPPGAPNLLEPLNGAGKVPLNVTLKWSRISGANSYHLQLGTNSNFTALSYENSAIADTVHQPSGLKNSTSYFWRVRANNAGGPGNWSTASTFSTVESAPAAPQLAAPLNGARSQSIQPVLKWSPANGATTYRLQLSLNAAFSGSLILDESLPDTSRQVPTGLEYAEEYYWRVNASNDGGSSSWSSVWTFETMFPPPPPPSLVTPEDEAMDQPPAIELRWNTVTSAVSYHVQLAASETFSEPLVDSNGVQQTQFSVSGLDYEEVYFWRVRSENAAGPGPWSPIRKFSTASGDASAPELVSPPNGATGIPTNPTLTWGSVPLATGYHLQVSSTTDFSGIVADENDVSSTSLQITGLAEGTTYYWRVRAHTLTGTSGWSTVWGFTTVFSPPAAPVLALPEDGAVDRSIELTLSWNSVSGASTYRFELSRTPSFSSRVVDSTGISGTKILVSFMLRATTYYWRVTASNPAGSGPSSAVRSFTTVNSLSTGTHRISLNFPSALKATSNDYRLVGFPGDEGDLIQDILAGKNGVGWRAYWDNGQPSNYLVEVVSGSQMRFGKGRAFWLIHDGPISLESDILPYPLNAAGEAEIPLHTGWNIITHPFPQPVDWAAVQALNGIQDILNMYEGSFTASDSLHPYKGYYMFNSANLQVLRIPPSSTQQSASRVAPQAASAAGDRSDWRVHIEFTSGNGTVDRTWFGVRRGASPDLDPGDVRKPRTVGDVPQISFMRPAWDAEYPSFASDIRPRVDDIQTWDFEVSGPSNTRCDLYFRGMESVPVEFDVYFVDEARKRVVNVRREHHYEFLSISDKSTMKVILGKPEAVRESLPQWTVPTDVSLGSNYPNPFNPTTIIPVSIPVRMNVTVAVYDALGRNIKILYDGSLEPGSYNFVWDGTSSLGYSVASGLYFSRLTAGKADLVRKMLLLK